MLSIIQQLQKDTLDSTIRLSDLLRRAKLIATKLGLEDFLVWINDELNGYEHGDKIPQYRNVQGEVKALHPRFGWQPVVFKHHELEDLLSERKTGQSVDELETLIDKVKGNVFIKLPLPSSIANQLRQHMEFAAEIALTAQVPTIIGILNRIRNILLEWSLELEKRGILGEGIDFSDSEKEKAQAAVYQIGNIENFAGNMGTVSGNASVSVQQINTTDLKELKSLVDQIRKHASNLGLSSGDQGKLQDVVAKLDVEVSAEKPGGGNIMKLLSSLKSIVEGASGNIVAQGILSAIAKYLGGA